MPQQGHVRRQSRLARHLFAGVCVIAVLPGCVENAANGPQVTAEGKVTPPVMRLDEEMRQKPLWRALDQITDNDLKGANKTLNAALHLDPGNADMHFLNAYVYEIRGREEGLKIAEQAPAGYLAAFNNDANHWAAAYRLGLWHLRQRQYEKARMWLGEAVLIKDDSPLILTAMAEASYMSFDPDAASAFLDRAEEIEGETKGILRGRAMVSAALGDRDDAKAFAARYADMVSNTEARLLDRRLRQWRSFHDSAGPYNVGEGVPPKVRKTQFFGGQSPTNVPSSSAPTRKKTGDDQQPEELKKLPGVLVIDAVIIRQKTSIQESRGVNLMSQLQATFSGNVLDLTRNSTTGQAATNVFENTYKINLGSGTTGSITYSLNIANNTDSRTEVLARPSITVVDAETGTFFLGEEVTYTITGDNADSFDKEVGITFEVTPELLNKNRVRLEARAEFDTFTAKDANVGYDNVIPTLKNNITSTAILELGQTLVLGGGTQEQKSKSEDSTPILGRVPLLQYFFKQAVSTKADTALIFLITPRLAETLDDPDQIEDAAGEGAENVEEAVMDQLRRRFRAWFNPTSNMTKALIGVSYSDLYREFREGDLRFRDDDGDGDFDKLLEDEGSGFLDTYEEGFWPELLRYFYFK